MAQLTFSKRLWQYFLTGLFVMIPAAITIFLVVALVQSVDKVFQFQIPGEGIFVTVAMLTLLGFIVSVGVGRRVFQLFEEVFLHIPGVGAFYKTVKALTNVFSPASHSSFRQVVLVEYPHPGSLALGFVTGEVRLESAEGTEYRLSVYVPTNNLYIGSTIVVRASSLRPTELTVPEAVQVVLSGGANFPDPLRLKAPAKP